MSSNQESLISADEVMRRVRMRLGVGDIVAAGPVSASLISVVTGATSAPPSATFKPPTGGFKKRDEYVVSDFLGYDDLAFLTHAYQAILHREPDDSAHSHLDALRSGGATKIEILAALRWSPEGISHGVHIDGLLIPYKLHSWRRIPLLGWVLHWCHTLVRLPRHSRVVDSHISAVSGDFQFFQGIISEVVAEQGMRLESHERSLQSLPSTEMVDELGQRINVLAEQVNSRISAVSDDFQFFQGKISQVVAEQGMHLESHERSLQSLPSAEMVDELGQRINVLAEQVNSRIFAVSDDFQFFQGKISQVVAEQGMHLESHEGALQSLPSSEMVDELGHRIDVLAEQVAEQVAALHALPRYRPPPREVQLVSAPAATVASVLEADASAVDSDLDDLYAAFEEQFRGPQAQIRERLHPYLKFVTEIGAGTVSAPLLDLGCGRGEWLEILRDEGLQASGVDLNGLFVEECEQKGLQVEYTDALTKLRSLPNASLGLVTLFHLAEHLSFRTLVDLLDEVHRVLLPGGGLIVETPNPENALVAQWAFYMDPTHRNPLPPQMLRWMVQARGFVQSDIRPLFEARGVPEVEFVPDDVPGAATINALVRPLHASRDYAIMARKSVSLS